MAGLSYKSSIDFANNFNVTITRPLDIRTVVNDVKNLIDGSIKSPYKGMVVAVKNTSDLYMYITDGVNGANTNDNKNISDNDKFNSWSKVSNVEVVEGESNRGHFTSDGETEPIFNNKMLTLSQGDIDGLINPQEGLILNIRNTDQLYILVKPDNEEEGWNRKLENYLRIGGVTEEHSYPILTPLQYKKAKDCSHNHFSEGDFYILLDPKNNPKAFYGNNLNDGPHVEMATKEMLDDNQNKILTTITDNIKTLTNKHNEDFVELNKNVNNLKNLILHGSKDEGVEDGNHDIETTLKSIHYISDWLKNHEGEYNDLVETSKKGDEELEKSIETLREELEDIITTIQGELEDSIGNLQGELEDSIGNLQEDLNDFKEDIEDKFKTFETKTDTSIHDALYYDVKTISVDGETPDEKWETVQVGGIQGGLTWKQFVDDDDPDKPKKTISQMLTDILFPTLEPNVPSGKPTAGNIIGGTSPVLVGTEIPQKNTFSYSGVDSGKYYYITPDGKKIDGQDYAGEPTCDDITIDKGSFGGTFEEGVYTISGSVTFATGPKPVTNKGVKTGKDGYGEKTIPSTSKMIVAVYPIYVTNGSTISEHIKQTTLRDYITTTATIEMTIPEETDDEKLTIKIPSSIKNFEVNQFNTLSGKYDGKLYFKDPEEVPIEYDESKGLSCKYNVYVKDGPKSGSQKIQIKIKV